MVEMDFGLPPILKSRQAPLVMQTLYRNIRQLWRLELYTILINDHMEFEESLSKYIGTDLVSEFLR